MPRNFDETQTGTPTQPYNPPGSPDTPDLPGHVGNPVTGTPYTTPAPTPTGPQGLEDIEGTPEQKAKAAQDEAFRRAQEELRQQELAKKAAEDAQKAADEAAKKKTGTVTVVPVTVTPGTGATSTGRDALARLKSLFASYGLPSSLGDWAWGELQNGSSEDEVTLALRDRPEFKARFPAIDARMKAGLSPLSPAEYVAYEQQHRQLMERAGLPPSFYDSPDDVTDFLAKDVSIAELSSRIQTGFIAVKAAPQAVRDEFARLYGVDGDAALAAFVLDRSRSEDALSKVIGGANAAGIGWSYGVRLDRKQADWFGDQGLSTSTLDQGFARVQSFEQLFHETASEQTDLNQQTGIDAVFGKSLDAQDAILGRVAQRSNTASTGASGATDQGGAYAARAMR